MEEKDSPPLTNGLESKHPTTTTGTSNSTVGSSSGFFSLGESNIAERARKLKQEKGLESNKKKIPEVSTSDNGTPDSHRDENGAISTGDDEGDLHEFDSLYISNQVNEKENVLHKSLVEGFKALKEGRDDFIDDTAAMAQAKRNRRQYSATVNFIDPTTKSGSSPTSATTKPTNMLQQQSMFQKQDTTNGTNSIENVYEKLTYIFERDYRSTIRSVQYKNLRTGETEYIGSLPINPVLTRTGGAVSSDVSNKNVNTPWGGTSSTAIVPVSDPSEWHTGPFCHVYIAACENYEHYRTKIRPALQAFVSQIESAASNTAGNQQGGHSADYLIVYIPVLGGASASNIKDSSLSNDLSGSGSRVGLFQKARKRFGGSMTSSGTAGEDDELGSRGSLDSDEAMEATDVDDPDAIAMSVALNLLSRAEQKLYKKIVADFPNGKACVLSTTSLDRSDEDMTNSDTVAIRTQEWTTFNRMLGAVIVNGFLDRCRRYKDELKRLDAQRATAATAAKNQMGGGIGNSKPQKKNPYAFNLSHFFLVKESLAFTYEQMQLPAEALLQYDEFRLYMPDLSDKEERKVRRARRKSKALADDDKSPSLAELADAGEFLGFRKKIRTEYDLTAILDIIRRYLFARELALLFRLERPVELLSRCQLFVKNMYAIMLRGLNELDEDEQRERKAKAAMWVIQFSWDVKCAVDLYLKSEDDSNNLDNHSVDTSLSDLNSGGNEARQAQAAVASKVSELLEVSRLLLMELGDVNLADTNPLRDFQKRLPDDLAKPWDPWVPLEAKNEPDKENGNTEESSPSENQSLGRRFLLQQCFSSGDKFEKVYLELCNAIIAMSRKAKRRRFAARLHAEVAEYYVCKGDLMSAIPIFKRILKTYRLDQWDRCHFWRLFRLAYCQRTTAPPTEYLKTLVSCFSPRLAAAAPKNALIALQDDLERVLEQPVVAKARYGRLSFIDASIDVINTSSKESTLGSGIDRKRVAKRFCYIGESVRVVLLIKSYLPNAIELRSAKIFIVAFGEFASIVENSSSVEEEDAFKVLSIDSPVRLNPGNNAFTLTWSPTTAGQYILSTVELIWKEGFFYYDSTESPDPLFGIDVLPSEPAHSISLDPEFLVPGHDQEISICFQAGSDIVTSGKLALTCTSGIVLIPPGEDPASNEWRKDCEIDFPSCNPGETHTLKAHVRCGMIDKFSHEPVSQEESMDHSHGLRVKVFTTYLHSQNADDNKSDLPPMKNVSEFFLPVLEKTALSVESIDTHCLEPNDKFVISVLLNSNTPYSFLVESWDIQFLLPLKAEEHDNLNEDLVKRFVTDGDQLCFAFECKLDSTANVQEKLLKRANLQLKLRDDTGKIFSLELPLDLGDFQTHGAQLNSSISTGTASAILKPGSEHGFVGEPVSLRYDVDTSSFANSPGCISFMVYSEAADWIVAGRVSGVLEAGKTSFSCEFTGIPVATGILKRFPKIRLQAIEADGNQFNIPVDFCHPEDFQSLPKTEHNGVASPVLK